MSKQVPGWPEYEIDECGTVTRVAASFGTRPGKTLKWHVMRNGYAKVSLCRNAKRAEYLVHRLVAAAFLGDIPDGMDVCHNDGNKLNNEISNLRIDTRAANVADNVRLDKHNRGERCGSNRHPEWIVRAAKARLLAGEKPSAVAKDTGIPLPTIYCIRSGQTWGWLSV